MIFTRLGLVFLCLIAACATPSRPTTPNTTAESAAPTNDATPPLGQLPQHVKPRSYALRIEIIPSKERFTGQARIAIELARPVSILWLHGKDLNVQSARATHAQGTVEARYSQYNEHGLASLTLAQALPAGQATLEIVYDAPFDKQLTGLYKVDLEGQSYAFTQFEAVAARQAFPCFDEPAFKTPFDIELVVQNDHVAIGNTPELESTVLPSGQKLIRFATTKQLPTYLLAFIVGPLDVVQGQPIPANDVRKTPLAFRGVAVRGRGERLAYALEHTAPLVAELERYFGIAYPYEKLDVIAVPDFGAGAMENAGAITFREWLLLLDAKAAPEGQRRAFASVMAHELAHQWFGNLVTMPWWDEIWLNEAFATWMAARTVAAVHPEYRADTDLLSSVINVMDSDSRVSARKIRQPIESTHDIANAFDGITYQKGAGVLGMFERYLGAETFRQGLQKYLQEHAFGNATASDLFAAFGQAANKDVSAAMSSFLDQAGVPLLSVDVQCATDPNGAATLRLSQSRYLPLGSEGSRAQLWQLPVCVRYELQGKSEQSCTLLTAQEGTLQLAAGGCPAWVMPNAEGAGYFRFAMDAPDFAALRSKGFAKLSAREKQSFVDSLSSGFASGAISAREMLEALPQLANDADRAIATAPMKLLDFTRERLLEPAQRPALDRFAKELYGVRARGLGWKERRGDDGETKLVRSAVLSFYAQILRDPQTRKTAAELGRRYLGLGAGKKPERDSVPPDLRRLVISVAIQEGDQAMFDAVYERFVSAADPDERGHLLNGLLSVEDARRDKALALTLDPRLRVNEVYLPLRAQTAEETTREAAWAYFEQHYDAIVARISPRSAARMTSIVVPFCSRAMAERAAAFFAPRIEALEGGPRSLASALEALRLCAAQADAQKASARTFFENEAR